jgi:HD-GYP domain-containing protein (c-di-GMP phosphodiesterase class II)
VSIIAMSMGLHMRLPRDLVETLGICGLFHDLGKVDIPIEIITKQGKLSDSERDTIEKHSIYSVNKILRLNASRELKHKILIAPLEHHMKYDLSGYPQMQSKKKVSFIGRILAIADVFDALTSPRSYRKIAFSPDRALAIMLQQSGRDFDPILLKIFINMLGVYPVGTLLKFDTGELGLVCGRKKGTTGVRPDVVIIDKDDSGYKKGEKVSLDQCDAVSGEYRRNIIKSYHPSQFGIQAARYI